MQPGGVLILVVGLIHHEPGQVCSALETMAVCSWSWRREVLVLYVEMDKPNSSIGLIEQVEIAWGCGCPTACKMYSLGRVKGRGTFPVI